jgi:hypothetical protein
MALRWTSLVPPSTALASEIMRRYQQQASAQAH